MNRKNIASILIPIAVLVVTFFIPTSRSDDVHFHAGFDLYRDGELVDLAKLEYMLEKPCTLDEHEEPTTLADEQIEKAHLHDLVGDVVHVHSEHATWGDLFRNIGITFTEPVTGYTAIGTITDVLNQEIIPSERIVIAEGELADPEAKLAEVPDEARIRQVEATSENCGS